MKLAVIGDLHWGARNDNSEFLKYFQRFFDEVFFPELEKRNIKTILQVGDFMDRRKYVNYVTLNHVRKFLFTHSRKLDIKWDILVGNHDTPYRNTNDISSLSELFSEYDDVRFFAEPTEVDYDGLNVLLLPWINPSNADRTHSLIRDTNAQIAFGHLEIVGFEMYKGVTSHEGMDASILKKFDSVYSGHFHRKSSKGNINYLGTPYEITWSDYNEHKGFYIFDTDTRDMEFIENPLHIFHKVWYNDDGKELPEILATKVDHLADSYVKIIVQGKKNPYSFDLFVNKIYDVSPIDVSIVEDHYNLDDISEADLVNDAEDTLTTLTKYIKDMENSVDKNSLEKLMRSLYNEAVTMENDSE